MQPRRRFVALVTAVLAGVFTSVFTSCASQSVTGSSKPLNLPYGVVYGTVTTRNNSTAVLVSGQAYLDSASALRRDSSFGGFDPIGVDNEGNYVSTIYSAVPRKVYFNLIALSARPDSADTVYAVPVQLDSLGGTPPHDSVLINFLLP
jgi:hypothetical protein